MASGIRRRRALVARGIGNREAVPGTTPTPGAAPGPTTIGTTTAVRAMVAVAATGPTTTTAGLLSKGDRARCSFLARRLQATDQTTRSSNAHGFLATIVGRWGTGAVR